MSRYRADEAVAWIWDDGERTCVAWRSATAWECIKRSLTSALRPCGLRYDPLQRRWSVPAWTRGALEEWARSRFEPGCIRWDDEPAGWYRAGRAG